MKKLIVFVAAVLFCSITAVAQTKPFVAFNKAAKIDQVGFAGSKEDLSRLFNQERIRLGDDFETELWKYLGDDPEKHYWIGMFLEEPSYLHGSPPLPELSLKIWQRGVELAKDDPSEDAQGRKFSTLVVLAILAQKQGHLELAASSKKESERMTESGFESAGHFPAVSEFERCLFLEIGGDVSRCGEEKHRVPQETIVRAGHMKTPGGGDPRDYRALVKVDVVIDETGKVISAKPIEGPVEFHARAVALAQAATFPPTKLSGKPVKVQGVLTYYLK